MLEVSDLTKQYGDLTALDQVSVTFRPGEVHAVVGENGAGKSTLVGIVSGFVTPTKGRLTLDGAPIPTGEPFRSRQRGIEMIHQHFTLVPEFTALENLALSRLHSLFRPVDLRQAAKPCLDAAERLGWSFELDAKVRNLAVGVQQRLEILKALGGDARVVLFDEPTAVLGPDEVEELLTVLRRLADEGRTVILIAHKLSEVLSVADRLTVLRRGKKVAEAVRGEFDSKTLANWMVGEMPPEAARTNRQAAGDILVRLKNVSVQGDRGETAVRDLNLDLRRGEILGIGGVDGNGQNELAEALAGVRPLSQGVIETEMQQVSYIPQDRQKDGLAVAMTIQDNLLVSGYRLAELSRGFLLSKRAVQAWAKKLMSRFEVKAESPDTQVSALSGGNQQKVVVARVLDRTPDLLVVASPTRGLDFRSTRYVHQQILLAKEAGAAVVLISPDLDELAELSDRTCFLSRGQLTEGQGAEALLGGTA